MFVDGSLTPPDGVLDAEWEADVGANADATASGKVIPWEQ